MLDQVILSSDIHGDFTVAEAFKAGWELMASNPGIAAIITIYFGLGLSLSPLFENIFLQPPPIHLYVLFIVESLLGWIAFVVFIKAALVTADNKTMALNKIPSASAFINCLLWALIYMVTVLLGLVLAIVPGLILAARLYLAPFIIVDKGLSTVEALRRSWAMTKGSSGKLLLIMVIYIVSINIASSLSIQYGILSIEGIFILAGLFFALPTTLFAMIYVYRKLYNYGQIVSAQRIENTVS